MKKYRVRYRRIKYRNKRSDAVFRAIVGHIYTFTFTFCISFDDWSARNLIP